MKADLDLQEVMWEHNTLPGEIWVYWDWHGDGLGGPELAISCREVGGGVKYVLPESDTECLWPDECEKIKRYMVRHLGKNAVSALKGETYADWIIRQCHISTTLCESLEKERDMLLSRIRSLTALVPAPITTDTNKCS